MIEIDGSIGEGGGQIVRTALTLAMCTGSAVAVHNIRAQRANPGLRAQHLAAMRAAAAISGARYAGATPGSRELSFEPGPVRAGRYEIDVGTAGSTMLVLQTILPALSLCASPSEVLLRGGTHNPRAPTFEFVRDAYLPALRPLGFSAQLALERHGFFPHGGGIVRASLAPLDAGRAFELLERGPVHARSAEVLLCNLPEHIGQREIEVLRARLGLGGDACRIQSVPARGSGNALQVRIDCEHVTNIFVGCGTRGVPAEQVAGRVAYDVQRFLDAEVAVDARLADQLLLPLAMTLGGRFSTQQPSGHTRTNAAVIQRFLSIDYLESQSATGQWVIALRRAMSREAGPPRR
jgi:RNA 3'-terminal phosphate cyclase (ATP)